MYLDWVEMREGERWRRERLPPIARVWPAVHRRETGGRGGGGAVAQPHNPANDTTMLETPSSTVYPPPSHRLSSQKIFKVQIYSPQTTEGVSHIHLVLAIKYRISLVV